MIFDDEFEFPYGFFEFLIDSKKFELKPFSIDSYIDL